MKDKSDVLANVLLMCSAVLVCASLILVTYTIYKKKTAQPRASNTVNESVIDTVSDDESTTEVVDAHTYVEEVHDTNADKANRLLQGKRFRKWYATHYPGFPEPKYEKMISGKYVYSLSNVDAVLKINKKGKPSVIENTYRDDYPVVFWRDQGIPANAEVFYQRFSDGGVAGREVFIGDYSLMSEVTLSRNDEVLYKFDMESEEDN